MGARINEHPYTKNEPQPIAYTLYTKTNSKWIINLNAKCKTTAFLEDRKKSSWLWAKQKLFRYNTTKNLERKSGSQKNLLCERYSWVERVGTESEQIFENHRALSKCFDHIKNSKFSKKIT